MMPTPGRASRGGARRQLPVRVGAVATAVERPQAHCRSEEAKVWTETV